MRKLNIQCLIETVLYILFVNCFIGINHKRQISFIRNTTRMKPYLYFMVVVLFLFGIFSFLDYFNLLINLN